MFHSPFQRKLINLRERFSPSEVIREEAIVFASKLPNNIQVGWQREGRFIIGQITDGENMYYTQAKSAKEFVEMVSDVIYSVYGVKLQYYRILGEHRYFPSDPKEFERLNNKAIFKSEIRLAKQHQMQGA